MGRVSYARKTADAPVMAHITEPNWPALIGRLCQKSIPKKQIAERCDMSRQVLYYIIAGRSVPQWRQGQLLIDLHQRVVVDGCELKQPKAAPVLTLLLGQLQCQKK